MRLASFSVGSRATWGIVIDDQVYDVGAAWSDRFSDLLAVIAQGALESLPDAVASATRYDIAEVDWLPVLPKPGKILCIGLNYKTHTKEVGRADPEYPPVFIRFADSQLGHDQPLVRPHVSTRLDYEGELAIIIGAGGRYIARDKAMAHVAGYACYNDASVRDWQRHTIQFTPGKNFPGTGAFGPVLVTADEIPDYRELHLQTRVNGAVVQDAGLDELIFDIPALIEYCSAFTPLAAGDVIVTGTPGGVGALRDPPVFLKAGDIVEVDVPGVGLLRNGVVDDVEYAMAG